LRVAADPEAPPFLSRTADGGWEGFEYGVMSALAGQVGVPLEIVPASFGDLVARVTAGDADLAIGQLSPSSAWSGVRWSLSYLQYGTCLVVPASSKVRSLADLRGQRVGMYDDPVATQATTVGVGAAYERVLFDTYGYFEQLARGRIDAFVYDCPLARWELRAFGDQLRIVDDTLDLSTYNVAMSETDAALQADVDRVLRGLGDQGLLTRLEQQWLGQSARAEDYSTTTGRVVVARRGDTLQRIAARELGEEARWTELFERNRDLLGDSPDAVYAGLRLRVDGAPPTSRPPRASR
jgi:ABC-type amino acid transport substrate-binding protein